MNSRILLSLIFLRIYKVIGCGDNYFEGFGVFLGSMHHFAKTPNPEPMIQKVFNLTYNDLGIRFYRTSYESSFSLERDVYDIKCAENPSICAYIKIHEELSNYVPNISVMASVWSPPHYMKTKHRLKVSEETNYYYFLRNITALMKSKFKIDIERISPVNEPENIFATWEHTLMSPKQLCRMVQDFNDSLISVCPENAYFIVSEELATNTRNGTQVSCMEACQIFGTHAYFLHLGDDENSMLAYYDDTQHKRTKIPLEKPIWQTEVSSTFYNADKNQMEEALDFATNIYNFVGYTCVQRYYFWYAYTLWFSGESLMWGSNEGGLTLPKKYFVYKHFTQAAFGEQKKVKICGEEFQERIKCITFGSVEGNETAVFINKLDTSFEGVQKIVGCKSNTLCCTNDADDWNCSQNANAELPSQSVCSCNVK